MWRRWGTRNSGWLRRRGVLHLAGHQRRRRNRLAREVLDGRQKLINLDGLLEHDRHAFWPCFIESPRDDHHGGVGQSADAHALELHEGPSVESRHGQIKKYQFEGLIRAEDPLKRLLAVTGSLDLVTFTLQNAAHELEL